MIDHDRQPRSLILLCIGLFLVLLSAAQNAPARDSRPACETTKTHCVLMSFPRFYMDHDEPAHEREARLKRNADGIDAATDSATERAWLVVTAWKESRLARFVDLDHPKCREGHDGWCDSGKAYGPSQLHGTDRDLTKKELYAETLRRFRRAANYCAARGYEYWLGGTALYGTGNRCTLATSAERVKMMWALAWRLQ